MRLENLGLMKPTLFKCCMLTANLDQSSLDNLALAFVPMPTGIHTYRLYALI